MESVPDSTEHEYMTMPSFHEKEEEDREIIGEKNKINSNKNQTNPKSVR